MPDTFAVQREDDEGAVTAVEPAADVAIRGMGFAHLRTTTDLVDNLGNVLEQTAHGRVMGEFGEEPDEDIVTHTTPALVNSAAWIWRTERTFIDGHGDATPLGDTTNTFNAVGDLTLSVQQADLPPIGGFDFSNEGVEEIEQDDQLIIASTEYDGWGNAVSTCAGDTLPSTGDCLRYAEVDYDTAYAQLPVTKRVAVDRGPGTPRSTVGDFRVLATSAVWERGLGVLLQATDPNGQETTVGYDGLGRLTFLEPPPGDGCSGGIPLHRFRYELVPGTEPISVIHATRENDCAGVGTDTLETRTYVDGLGRTRASLTRAEGPDRWVQAGVVQFTPRGQPFRAFQPAFLSGADPDPGTAVALPSVPQVESVFDAFDRQIIARAEDGAETITAYHALSTTVWDPLDLYGDGRFLGTPAITRMDGHGRVIDQLLWNRQPGSGADEHYRLFTTYRADGAVLALTRAQTSGYLPSAMIEDDRFLTRTFIYDTAGRRIASFDPDTDSRDGAKPVTARTWRYLFNRVGDLAAVRDPRGCGQDFFYDHGGRLIGEDYVQCAEAQDPNEEPDETVPGDAIRLDEVGSGGRAVDVRYYFDELPPWAGDLSPDPARPSPPFDQGRLTASSDRGQRSLLAYDARGNVVWTARQMALLPEEPRLAPRVLPPNPHDETVDEIHRAPATRTFDPTTYVQTFTFDHADRPTSTALPRDPDWETLAPPGPPPGPAPVVTGHIEYNRRSLPSHIRAEIDGIEYPITDAIEYTRDGLVDAITYGDTRSTLDGTARTPTETSFVYDHRRRLRRTTTTRAPTRSPDPTTRDLGEVTRPVDQEYVWDEANNLVGVTDLRDPLEWPEGHRPPRIRIGHDALYRVSSADYDYRQDDGDWLPADTATDWRDERTRPNLDGTTHESADPMREEPAPMVTELPSGRVASLVYQYDWLANMTEWTDDQNAFYERSIGAIENGFDDYDPSSAPTASPTRPTALHLAHNLTNPDPTDRGGWVELDYGEGGNVTAMTVHGQCRDAPGETCGPPAAGTIETRRAELRERCACQTEQHYRYRWDELNRLAEARRYDRARARGPFRLVVRQRYRYDAGNQRTIKQTLETDPGGDPDPPERVQLYVYPGDYVRTGLTREPTGYAASRTLGTETQYLLGGARIVWKDPPDGSLDLSRDARITYALTDLIQSTSAVLDLHSGELLEVQTFYPNGAQETHLTQHDVGVQPEPLGFTGKEEDAEVGLVYFGERYLIPRLGRWASSDPLHIHSSGGGEALNSYHYVAGNLLQQRDPIGLDPPPEGLHHQGSQARHVLRRLRDEEAEWQSRYSRIMRRVPDWAFRPPNQTPPLEEGRDPALSRPAASWERQLARAMNPSAVADNLVSHYTEASGLPYVLSTDEMVAVRPGAMSLRQRARGVIQELAAAGGGSREVSFVLQGRALERGTLGQFRVDVRGVITVEDVENWTFEGEMTFFDVYDFDSHTGRPSYRSSSGEARVTLAREHLPGKAFYVFSEALPVREEASSGEIGPLGLRYHGDMLQEAPQGQSDPALLRDVAGDANASADE